MTIHDGAVGDKRKSRLPEIEMEPTTLRAKLEYALEGEESARNRATIAEKQRDEATVRVSELEHRLVVADEKVGRLTQAMFDGWAALGFDTDGDTGPGAMIAGAGLDGWISWWLRDVREHVKDNDDGDEESEARIAQLTRSMRAVVLMLQDDQPAADVIQAISDALEVRHG